MILFFSATAFAATLDVCDTCAYTTVGDAVAAASPGDTVLVAAGVYDETDLVIDFDLTLIGAGSAVTTLRSASDQVLYLGSPSTSWSTVWPTIEVSGFELEPTVGRGAFALGARATLTDIRVDDVTGTEPGLGLWIDGAEVTIVDSTFEDLVTTDDGAAIYYYPTVYSDGENAGLNIEGCAFDRNSAVSGGAIAAYGHYGLTTSDSSFSGNTAVDGGAVMALWGIDSTNDVFTGNAASGEGGAVHGDGVRATGSTFSANSAAYGGAIAEYGSPGTTTVTDGLLEGNQASVEGGDLHVSMVTLTNTTVTGSSAPQGGSVMTPFEGFITLDGVTVSGVQTDGYAFGHAFHGIFSITDSSFDAIDGDGAYALTSEMYVTRSSFSNIAGVAVTGNDAPVEVEDSSFVENESGARMYSYCCSALRVSNSSFVGHTRSALYGSYGPIEVIGSMFDGNASPGRGGAIAGGPAYGMVLRDNVFLSGSASEGGAVAVDSSGPDVVTGNRFCGNTAGTGGAVSLSADGGASSGSDWRGNLFVGNTATEAGGDLYLQLPVTLANNTFVDGYAPAGGSVWSDSDLVFRDNIVAWAEEYALYGAGGVATIAYNDFWEVAPDAVGGTWAAADGTNLAVDPMWVSYVEGGCEELDLGLLPDSALWDAGDPSGTDADGTRTDIGMTGGASPGAGTRRWYLDGDGDGFGVEGGVAYSPTAPVGYASTLSDCDDADADAFPGNLESCDGRDEDCDGVADDEATDAPTWRPDADGDGYQEGDEVTSCEPPPGWEPKSGAVDCDGADPAVHPDAVELCDDVDQDCDSRVDDVVTPAWRPDADGDGYQSAEEVEACEGPAGWQVAYGPVDCDDADPTVHPGAPEIEGDGVDQDCDGAGGEPPDTDLTADTDGLTDGDGCKGCGGGGDARWGLALAALALARRGRAASRA